MTKEQQKSFIENGTLEETLEMLNSLENNEKIQWGGKSRNPSLDKLTAYEILKKGLISSIETKNERLKQYPKSPLNGGERLIIKNAIKEFGKYI